jgi:hypothetical protein
VYLARKDNKLQPISYEEGRTADDFLEFLRKNSTAKIPKFKKKEAAAGGAAAEKDEL